GAVGVAVVVGDEPGGVGGVEGEVEEEGVVGFGAVGEPGDGLVEEGVGAVAGELFFGAVGLAEVGVEVVVVPVVGGGGDVGGGEPECGLEAAVLGAIG